MFWIKAIRLLTSKYAIYIGGGLVALLYVFYLGFISRQHTIEDLEFKYQVAVGQIEMLNAQVTFSQDLADRFTTIDNTLSNQIVELGKVRGSIRNIKPTTIINNPDTGSQDCVPSKEFSERWNEIGSQH